jgi:hypothetical protein
MDEDEEEMEFPKRGKSVELITSGHNSAKK